MTNPQSQPFGSDPSEARGVNMTEEPLGTPISAGFILRQARESSGLHIAALAGALKVPVKKLEALEMDRYDLLPDTVFVRALASSVCRTLKVEAAPVLALLPQTVAPLYGRSPLAVPSSFSDYQPAARPVSRSSLSGPAVIAGLLLVACTAILVFLPVVKDAAKSLDVTTLPGGNFLRGITGLSNTSTDAGGGQSQSEPTILLSSETLSLDGKALITNPPSDTAATISSPIVSLNTASAIGPPQSVGSAIVPASSASSSPDSGSSVVGSSDRLVTFIAAAQPSWVKVTDAKGAVVLSRTIAPGEAVSAGGSLPLAVVVGRADATRVQVRGQAFDLTAFSRENVARFEVK
jgi:cytoskeleton protein RodZ